MSDVVRDAAPRTDREFQQALAECLREIDRLREQMARDGEEIDRLHARNQARLKEVKAMLRAA